MSSAAPTEIYNPHEKRNQNIYLIGKMLETIGMGLCSQGYVQAYLMGNGMSSGDLGVYGAFSQVFSIGAYLLFTFHKPTKGYLRGYLTGRILYSLYPLILLAAGIFAGNIPMMLGAVCISAGISGYMNASAFACQNCMIPMLFSRKDFGILQGRSGLIGGILTTIISMLASFILSKSDETIGYIAFFAGGAFVFLISALSAVLYKMAPVPMEVEEKTNAKFSAKAIFNKHFMYLMAPHFLRGIGGGGFYYFIYVALQNITLTPMENSLLVTVSVAGSFISCIIFTKAIKMGVKTGVLVQYSQYICIATLLLTTYNKNNIVFFVLYFIEQIAFNIVGYLVPVGVMRSTKTEDLPLVTPIRMIMVNGGNSLSTFLWGQMFAFFPAIFMMGISCIAFAGSAQLFRKQLTDWAG